MRLRVLLIQPDKESTQTLTDYFKERGDEVLHVWDLTQADALLELMRPDLILMDMHFRGDDWLDFLRETHRLFPQIKIILTNRYPDLQRELISQSMGFRVFVRQPFTQFWLDQALRRLKIPTRSTDIRPFERPPQPKIMLPLWLKIVLPYIALALALAGGGIFLIQQAMNEASQKAFAGRLDEAGLRSALWIGRREEQQLASLRQYLSYSRLADAVQSGSTQQVQGLLLSLMAKTGDETVEILDAHGIEFLSLRRSGESIIASAGSDYFQQVDFVQEVFANEEGLEGGYSSGLVSAPWGSYLYLGAALRDSSGHLAGVLLTGRQLDPLAAQMAVETLSQVTFYDRSGMALTTTLPLGTGEIFLSRTVARQAFNGEEKEESPRLIEAGESVYAEILMPWRDGSKRPVGLLGVALPQPAAPAPGLTLLLQILLLTGVALLLVAGVGYWLSGQITGRLRRLEEAADKLAQGFLDLRVDARGADEISTLARSFNHMIVGLQEGFIFRDLLGRSLSNADRKSLHETFFSGNLYVEGQQVEATVMHCTIRRFAELSQGVRPATIIEWLNEYFSRLVPIVTEYGGVIDRFDGEAVTIYYGILPEVLTRKVSSLMACLAAVDILEAVEQLNRRRTSRHEPPLLTSIGIHCGQVIAGGLGPTDRLQYTILGKTIAAARRLEALAGDEQQGSTILISQAVYEALEENQSEFQLQPVEIKPLPGAEEMTTAYHLQIPPASSSSESFL